MESATLIKALERRGFFLEFPEISPEEAMIEILKENNPRIIQSLPLFLKEDMDYKRIFSKLSSKQKKGLDKILLISKKIYTKEKIQSNLKELIKERRIKADYSKEEFEKFYDSFKEAQINLGKQEQKTIEKQSKLRLNLDLNKSISVLFSPAKVKIMEKIFNHEPLTNTELKYYYKAISNIDKSVLNPVLQNYLRIIEITRKIT